MNYVYQRGGSSGVFPMRWYIGVWVETCRRHVPSLWCDLCPRLLWWAWIIAYYQGSHGFNEIQRDDYLWEFVADYLEHGLHGLYGYVGLLNLVESVWGFCLLRGESSGFMNLWNLWEWGCSRRGCFLPWGGRFLSCVRWWACSFVCSSHSRRSAP